MDSNYLRHGDLTFHPVTTKPEGFKSLGKKKKHEMALGEATGHVHVAKSKTPFELFVSSTGEKYFEITAPTPISHEEHETRILQPGKYHMRIEREYDYAMEDIRQVED